MQRHIMLRSSLFFLLLLFLSTSSFPSDSLQNRDEYHRIVVDESFAHLKPVSETTFNNLKSIDPAIFDADVTANDVLECTISDFRTLLEQSLPFPIGVMHYFPHPYYHYSKKIHYWSRDALNVGNSEYHVGTIFPPRGRTRNTYHDARQTIARDTFFLYEGVLVGRGRLVVIYPHHISVHRSDAPFSIMTGNYDLYRVNILDNESEFGGEIKFTRIRGRDYPDQPFKPIHGPMNFPLTSVRLEHWSDKNIAVYLNFIWLPMPHPLFRRYDPPLYELPSEQTRIPPETIEYTRNLAHSIPKPSPFLQGTAKEAANAETRAATGPGNPVSSDGRR